MEFTKMRITEIASAAKSASIALAGIKSDTKNAALSEIASTLRTTARDIIAANEIDLANAKKENLSPPLLKRLNFDQTKIDEVCAGLESLIKLHDPVGQTITATELDHGLELYKVSCPIGVIGVIFESRPDALVQISSLCLKSGNAVLLKGGSEAINTNRILAKLITEASDKAGLPVGWLQLLETREDVKKMLGLDKYIDLIIPRGSNEFVRFIMDNTNVPVLGHADGICHVYVDKEADLDMAVNIAFDSKCQYCAVCNATENLIVHHEVAKEFLPKIKTAYEEQGVEIRGCKKTAKIIDVKLATEEDWATEYLDYIISIKIVDSIDEAIEHINTYGSGHTDAIITANIHSAEGNKYKTSISLRYVCF